MLNLKKDVMISLNEFIEEWYLNNDPKGARWLYKSIKSNELYMSQIFDLVSKEFHSLPFEELIYCFRNGLSKPPVCEECGGKLKFPYAKFCTRKCSQINQSKNANIIDSKRKQTNIDKYGVPYVMQVPEVKDKYIKNSIDKYGVDWVSKSNDVKKKISENWDSKSESEKIDVNEKKSVNYKKSIQKKYGVDSVFSLPEIQKKRIVTLEKNYGVTCPFSSPIIRQTIYETNKKKYGYENPMSNINIQKIHCESNFNLKSIFSPEGIEYKTQGDGDIILNYLFGILDEKNIFSEFDCPVIEYFEGDKKRKYRPDFFVDNTNTVIEVKSIYNLFSNWDNIILKNNAVLNQGFNLEMFITTNQKEIIHFNFRKTILYDVISKYSQNYLFGDKFTLIKDSGVIFNVIDTMESNDKRNLNSLKLHLSQNNNNKLNLINIFYDDWEFKREIIEARIKNVLGVTENKIFARKCSIVEVSASNSKAFLEQNHIQGQVGAKHRLGLEYEGNLVSLMTFGIRNDKMEMLRFCNKLNYSVVGGFSKLLKHFRKDFKEEIYSYADLDWTNPKENVYLKNGFSFVKKTEPGYFWAKDGKRFTRQQFQKHKLVAQGFDASKTEDRIMLERGYLKIYNSGNLLYMI